MYALRRFKNHILEIDKRLLAIVCLAAFFIFFKITHADMLGDDAHYSVRSIGLLDFMFGDMQTTPLQWFNTFPWWAHLSFHDHPLVLFIIQHWFLSLHTSIFFAKLPYALMALGTIALTYAWCKKLFSQNVGLLAALLLALNAHFIWFGRSAFMESGVLFMIALTWYYFCKFLNNQKYFWQWGIAFGLMLETKFTTFFAAGAMLAYVVIRERKLLRTRKFYYALGIATVIFLPEVLYNLMMYHATGHFALQLSRLLHQLSPWHLAQASFSPLSAILPNLTGLATAISWPAALVASVAFLYVLIYRKERWLLGFPILFLILEDVTIGSKELYSIFLAPITAVALYDLYQKVNGRIVLRWLSIAVGSAYALYLTWFIIASHLLVHHPGPEGWLRSSVTSDNVGVVQLDTYLDKIIAEDKSLSQFDPYGDLKVKSSSFSRYLSPLSSAELAYNTAHSNVILFDGNINWFSRVWLFERRRFYDNIGVISLNEQGLLSQLHLESFYFIKATDDGPLDGPRLRNDAATATEQNIVAQGISPDLIRRDDGEVAFKVYHVVAPRQ